MINLIAALGLVIVWLTFRQNLQAKRDNYLAALEELLSTVGLWFSSSYSNDMEKEEWKNPDYFVYKVNTEIVNAIIIDASYIFSNTLVKKLVQFVQLSTRFNQYIEAHADFVNTYYEKLKLNEETVLKRRMYALMRNLHVKGIGDRRYHDDKCTYPFLNECYHGLRLEVIFEKNRNVRPFYWKRFILQDIIFLIIPIGYMVYTLFELFN